MPASSSRKGAAPSGVLPFQPCPATGARSPAQARRAQALETSQRWLRRRRCGKRSLRRGGLHKPRCWASWVGRAGSPAPNPPSRRSRCRRSRRTSWRSCWMSWRRWSRLHSSSSSNGRQRCSSSRGRQLALRGAGSAARAGAGRSSADAAGARGVAAAGAEAQGATAASRAAVAGRRRSSLCSCICEVLPGRCRWISSQQPGWRPLQQERLRLRGGPPSQARTPPAQPEPHWQRSPAGWQQARLPRGQLSSQERRLPLRQRPPLRQSPTGWQRAVLQLPQRRCHRCCTGYEGRASYLEPACSQPLRSLLRAQHRPTARFPLPAQDPTLHLERSCLAALQRLGPLSPPALLPASGVQQLPAYPAAKPGEQLAVTFGRFLQLRPHLFGAAGGGLVTPASGERGEGEAGAGGSFGALPAAH
jgi:hypothetical protein